jgi:hypothetical protein
MYQLIALVLAILIWVVVRTTGNETHTIDGIIFFTLVVVEAFLFWLGNRKPR